MAEEVAGYCVKNFILKVLVDLKEDQLNTIEQWVCSKSYRRDLQKMRYLAANERKLKDIGKVLMSMVPFKGEMPSEHIAAPLYGDQADCTEANTCHVDEFLYDDAQTEQLVRKKKLKRHYCTDCESSENVKELIFISHSMSRLGLQYMFKVLLPDDLEGKQLLDVGSRLGAVLYGAYTLTKASPIIGVEMNKECCELQEKIINQFDFDLNRIKIVHSDITVCDDIVKSSDIIIINVLDFFVDETKHKEMWYFFKKNIKKGSYLVTNRAMPETLDYLGIDEEFMDWLSLCTPYQLENDILFNIQEFDKSSLFLYLVN